MKVETQWLRITVLVLVLLIAVMGFMLMQKKTVVTIVPWTADGEMILTKDDASRSYKEAWALAVTELVGNVTPSTVDFVSERLKPLLVPKIYHEVIL